MNFYFFMNLGCPLQEAYPPLHFIERLGLAWALQRHDQEQGVDAEQPAEEAQRRPLKVRLEGAERWLPRVEVRDLHNDFLGAARTQCLHCPINKTPDPCACVGVVSLPLSAKGEKWLFDQFAPPQPAKSYFAEHIRRSRLPGRRHELLLASSVEFKKQLTPDQPEITSTQLFYYLLNMRDIQYESRLRLLYEFGALKARPQEVDELSALIASATAGGAALAGGAPMGPIRKALDRFKVKMKFDKGDDDSISQLKQYFLLSLQSLKTGIPMHASLM